MTEDDFVIGDIYLATDGEYATLERFEGKIEEEDKVGEFTTVHIFYDNYNDFTVGYKGSLSYCEMSPANFIKSKLWKVL